MRTTLAVNPRRRRRRQSPRRRRRNPTLRIANPARRRRRSSSPGPRGMGGIASMLTPALMVALGALAGTLLPRTLKLVKSDASKTTLALAAIGTGIGLGYVGNKVVGKKNAEMLALGAMSAGLSSFLNQVLPAQMRLSGVGEIVTEADIDEEIRKLAAGGLGDTTQEAFSSFAGPEDAYSVEIAGADDYAMSTFS